MDDDQVSSVGELTVTFFSFEQVTPDAIINAVVFLCCKIGPSKSLQKASAPLQLQSPAKTDGNVGEFCET